MTPTATELREAAAWHNNAVPLRNRIPPRPSNAPTPGSVPYSSLAPAWLRRDWNVNSDAAETFSPTDKHLTPDLTRHVAGE